MKISNVYLRTVLAAVWYLAVAFIVLAALAVSLTRILLPLAGEYKAPVETWLSDYSNQVVRIGGLHAEWQGLRPQLRITDVSVLDATGERVIISFQTAHLGLDLVASVQRREWVPGRLRIGGASLAFTRHVDGSVSVHGLAAESSKDYEEYSAVLAEWLLRQRDLGVEDSEIYWSDEKTGVHNLHFKDVALRIRNAGQRHQIDGRMGLPSHLGESFTFNIDLQGDLLDPAAWRGSLYANGRQIQFAEWFGRNVVGDIRLRSGLTDFEVWSEWRGGRLDRVDGEFASNDLVLVAGERLGVVALSEAAARIAWRRDPTGWSLGLDDLTLARDGVSWPQSGFTLQYRDDQHSIAGRAAFVRLQDVLPLVAASRILDRESRDALTVLRPAGDVRGLAFRYSWDASGAPGIELRAGFSALSTEAWKRLPALHGLSGSIRASEREGELQVAGADVEVLYPGLFRSPIRLETVSAALSWSKHADGWRLHAEDITAANADLNTVSSLDVTFPSSGASPFVHLVSRFTGGDASQASKYYPVGIMPPEVVGWLDRAIRQGRIPQGALILHGALRDFPFERGNGKFEVSFDIEDAVLDYVHGWPEIAALRAAVTFEGRAMAIAVEQAKIFDSDITQADARIADLTAKAPVLAVQGRARVDATDGLRFLAQSGIGSDYVAELEELAISGDTILELALDVPLGGAELTRVNGSLQLDGNALTVPFAQTELSGLKGRLVFDRSKVTAQRVQASMLGRAVMLDLNSIAATKGKGGQLQASLTGRFGADDLTVLSAMPYADYLRGEADWRIGVNLTRAGANAEPIVSARVSSDLRGIEVGLPYPIGKTADQPRDLLVTFSPTVGGRQVELRYADFLRALFATGPPAAKDVWRGEVRFGGAAAQLPAQPGVSIAGQLDRIPLGEWLNLGQDQVAPDAAAPPAQSVGLAVTQVDLNIKQFEFLAQQLRDVTLTARNVAGVWQARIRSAQIDGTISVPPASGTAPLVMDFERLHLTKPQFETRLELDPRTLPPVRFTSQSVAVDELNLGRMSMVTVKHDAGQYMEQFALVSDTATFNATGDWFVEDGKHLTRVDINTAIPDLGEALVALDYEKPIEGGRATSELIAHWPGAPFEVNVDRLSGTLEVDIEDGRILDLKPGAGRVFGLLSLQALPRRLTLDFSDLFKKGFSFDRIAGSFEIEQGNAYTSNMMMEGPSAQIDISGRTGLAERDYDQLVTVTPKVTASLPVAGALVGGPLAGGVLFAFDKLFKRQINRMTRIQYTITGPWDAPLVQPLATQLDEETPSP